MKISQFLLFGFILLVSIVYAEDRETVVDIATSDENFSTLIAAVQAAGLVETLSGEGPFTVFAPTNDAFAGALDALGVTAEELLADTETLANILTYHVVPFRLLAADVLVAVEEAGGTISTNTANGAIIDMAIVDGSVVVNNTATVTTTDLTNDNGVIYVIDTVLLPPQ